MKIEHVNIFELVSFSVDTNTIDKKEVLHGRVTSVDDSNKEIGIVLHISSFGGMIFIKHIDDVWNEEMK